MLRIRNEINDKSLNWVCGVCVIIISGLKYDWL